MSNTEMLRSNEGYINIYEADGKEELCTSCRVYKTLDKALKEKEAHCDDEYYLKSIKISIVTMLISILGCTFIPSKEDLYLIYGAGTIVDYCKDSPNVKEIPDKAIDALNRYLDSIAEDKKDQ